MGPKWAAVCSRVGARTLVLLGRPLFRGLEGGTPCPTGPAATDPKEGGLALVVLIAVVAFLALVVLAGVSAGLEPAGASV